MSGKATCAPPARRPAPRPKATAPTEAPTKLASGTQVESSPPARTCGARAAPAITPATIPTKESICAARPRKNPAAPKERTQRTRRMFASTGAAVPSRREPGAETASVLQLPGPSTRRGRDVGARQPATDRRACLRRRSRATVAPDGSPLPWRMRGASPLAPRPHRATGASPGSRPLRPARATASSATAMFITQVPAVLDAFTSGPREPLSDVALQAARGSFTVRPRGSRACPERRSPCGSPCRPGATARAAALLRPRDEIVVREPDRHLGPVAHLPSTCTTSSKVRARGALSGLRPRRSARGARRPSRSQSSSATWAA